MTQPGKTSSDPTRKYYDEVASTLTRDELRSIQNERLSEVVHRVYENAPFYRRRFDEAGVKPGDITSVDDIGQLPLCNKDDLRASETATPPFGDYRCTGLDTYVRVAFSTGTTGKPTIAAWTKNDLDLEYALSARASWRIGLRPGMVVVNAHPGYLNGGEGFISGDCRNMGMLPISLGPPESLEGAAHALRSIEGIPVDHWRLFPSALHRFREAAETFDIKVDLPEADAGGPLQLYEKFGAGQECILVLGGTCGPGRGAHLSEDYCVVEVLDIETGEPVPDGKRGLFVATTLGRDNPMIRYNVEDVVRVESAICVCGETSRRGFYEGRLKDVVKIDDKVILPIDVWFELPNEAEYALVRKPGQTDLEVRVEGDVASDLADRLEARIGVPIKVSAIPEGTLPKAAFKPVRLIDES